MLNNEDQLSLTDESVLVTIEVNKHWNSENMGFPYSVLWKKNPEKCFTYLHCI